MILGRLFGAGTDGVTEVLEHVVWNDKTHDVAKTLHLLVRARRMIAVAAELKTDSWPLALIVERTDLLERGELSPHLTRWLSSHVTKVWEALRSARAPE